MPKLAGNLPKMRKLIGALILAVLVQVAQVVFGGWLPQRYVSLRRKNDMLPRQHNEKRCGRNGDFIGSLSKHYAVATRRLNPGRGKSARLSFFTDCWHRVRPFCRRWQNDRRGRSRTAEQQMRGHPCAADVPLPFVARGNSNAEDAGAYVRCATGGGIAPILGYFPRREPSAHAPVILAVLSPLLAGHESP